jgi:hypothetical protein
MLNEVRCAAACGCSKQGGNNDPKLEALIGYLRGTHPAVSRGWLDLGCILFSQYYDTVRWVGDEMAKRAEFAGMDIGLYAGSNRSGLWRDGKFQRCDRNVSERPRSRWRPPSCCSAPTLPQRA